MATNNRLLKIAPMALALALILCTATPSAAQSLTEDPAIARMMESFIAFNKDNQVVRGWRVQVLVTTDRRQMENVKREFEQVFPDYAIQFTHEEPFYHLKTGSFVNKGAALPYLREIQQTYPNAFLVTDEIQLSDVLTFY